MKGMDGPAFARQLSRDDSLFESGPASVPVGHVPVGHVVSAPQSLIQSGTVNQTQHSLAQYGLCNSNFRGRYGGELHGWLDGHGWSKDTSAGYGKHTNSNSPYTIYGDGEYPCTNASFPICGDAEGKGMYGLYVGTEAWRSGGWSRFGKCRAGAQFTRGLMNASLNLKFFPAECGTVMDTGGSVMHTCLSEYIQAAQEHAGCGDGVDCNMEDAALIAAAGAAARAAITAMDSQCMAKESHLAAMGAQISQVSLAMSDVAKEIKWRMSENNVSHAANWRFVVGNASKIAGKLHEVFQRGKVLEDRAPSKAISSAAQNAASKAAFVANQPDSYIGSLDAFCEKVKNITTTAIGEDGEAGMFKLYGNTDLLQMINALEMTVREVHCVAPKCVDGEYVVQPAPSAGGSGEYNDWVAQEAR